MRPPDQRGHRPSGASHLTLLAAINTGLVIALAVSWGFGAARNASAAQPAQRDPGRYTVLAADYLGGQAEALHIIDTENRELATLLYDPASKTVRVAGYRDLTADANARPGR